MKEQESHQEQSHQPVSPFPRVIFRTGSSILHYVLTPWSRVLLEKLTRSAASQEIPRIL